MYAIFSLSDGKLHEGLVLAVGSNRMRVALRDRPDTVELRNTGGQWRTDDGGLVELETILYTASLSGFLPARTPVKAA